MEELSVSWAHTKECAVKITMDAMAIRVGNMEHVVDSLRYVAGRHSRFVDRQL